MEASELDKAVEYTKQFIEAATPIAKRAYEIGLLTLRIDAAGQLFLATVAVIVCTLILLRVRSDYAKAKEASKLPAHRDTYRNDPSDHLPGDGAVHLIAALAALVGEILGCVALIDVWLWVKLISPELWLARMAIGKIIG